MNVRVMVFVSLFSLLPNAWAARVLIIGPVGTIQTIKDVLPSTDTGQTGGGPIPDAATLATFDEVWDLRGIPGVPLTSDEISRYVNYLALGKRLVVVGDHNSFCGETQCFKPRNDSLVTLVNAAGGGALQYDDSVESLSTETVRAPFGGPHAIAGNDVTWPSSSTVTTPGTGQFITVDPIKNSGTALAFGPGTLAQATAGMLVVVFETNWLEPLSETPTQNEQDLRALLGNIVSFLRAPQLPVVASVQCIGPGSSTPTTCTFDAPMGVAARNGNVYVTDTARHAVYRIDSATQQKVLIAGLQLDALDAPDVRYNGDGIDARNALLNNPTGLALDDAGNLYIADTGNHAIRMVAADSSGAIPDGAIITTVAGVPTQFGVGDPLLLFGPRGVAVDEEGGIFIADTMNQQIRKRAADGTLSVVAGVAGLPGRNNGPVACTVPCTRAPGRFNKPVGVAVDSSGRVFVADEGNNRIRMVSDGFVGNTTTANPLRRPTAIILSPSGEGTLLAADYGHDVIRQVAPCDDCSSPTPDVVAGTGEPGSTGASLSSPIGISVDGLTLYIADLLNQRIGKVLLSD